MSRLPPTVSSGLGAASVSGRMRSPRPAASTMAFTWVCAAVRRLRGRRLSARRFTRRALFLRDAARGGRARFGARRLRITGFGLRLARFTWLALRRLSCARACDFATPRNAAPLYFARVRRVEQWRDARGQPAFEFDQLRIAPACVADVFESQWQVGEITDLAVAVPQATENAEHLDMALHADEIEPAYELVFAVADIGAEIADHAPVAAQPALDALARPADVAVLEQRNQVVAHWPAQRILKIDDAGATPSELGSTIRLRE